MWRSSRPGVRLRTRRSMRSVHSIAWMGRALFLRVRRIVGRTCRLSFIVRRRGMRNGLGRWFVCGVKCRIVRSWNGGRFEFRWLRSCCHRRTSVIDGRKLPAISFRLLLVLQL